MTYEVYIDGNLLYYPNDETYVIINSTLNLALNEAGSFEFDVPTYNLRYDDFKLRKSMIQVLQNGEEIFYGEVREVKTNADFTKHVYAVGELAFLFDSIQPQHKYLTSPLEAFKALITKHNSQVESRKQYTVSQVSVTDSDNQIYFYTNGEDTLSIIRDKICDVLDGYIRVTKDASGKRYVGIVPLTYFGACTQEIQFGENLLDYSCNMSASDIATCVVPRGVKLEDEQRTADAVDGLDEYLSIKGTKVDYYHKDKNYDYVQLDEAIANFGYVRVLKTWDNVTIAENLKNKAIEWLKSAQYETMTLELKALDMAQFDVNIDTFKLGEQVHIWATPYGMDTSLPVRKKTIYLTDIDKNEVVLGNAIRQSFTSQQSKAVEQLREEIPQTFPILDEAKANAIAMLTDPAKGYVTYVFDKDGNRTEIWIADNKDQSQVTKKWVWNSSGLGYMYKEKGAWKTSVAITMNGAISANFITTGSLTSDVIKTNVISAINSTDNAGKTINDGRLNINASTIFKKINGNENDTTTINGGKITSGSITATQISANTITSDKINVSSLSAISANMGTVDVGGNKNGNGVLKVKDASGNVKIQLDNEGITADKGTIAGFTIGTFSKGESAELNLYKDTSHYIRLFGDESGGGVISKNGSNETNLGASGISTTGTISAGTSLTTQGTITSNGAISAGGAISTTSNILASGSISAHNYYTWEGETLYQGKDFSCSFQGYVDGEKKNIGLVFVDGLLVGTSTSDRD